MKKILILILLSISNCFSSPIIFPISKLTIANVHSPTIDIIVNVSLPEPVSVHSKVLFVLESSTNLVDWQNEAIVYTGIQSKNEFVTSLEIFQREFIFDAYPNRFWKAFVVVFPLE